MKKIRVRVGLGLVRLVMKTGYAKKMDFDRLKKN